MHARVAVALVLAALTGGLSGLAHASPPDPVWMNGVFDDGDADNVVEFIVSATALVEPLAHHGAPPTPVLIGGSCATREALPACGAFAFNPGRAPPSA